MKKLKDALLRLFGGPLLVLGVIGAILGLIVCLALMLAFIVRFNEAAPPAICAGAVVFIIFLLIRSYRKNRYWSGK
jgi:hypothetical protein